jgi:elongator complex protein 3
VDFFDEFVQAIVLGEVTDRGGVIALKKRLCKKHHIHRMPKNYEILSRVPEEYREIVEPLVRNKPIRTMSGVAPVAVMTSPYDCPHGRCSYCPGGTSNNTPQSYTGREPAALRAASNDYDPYRETKSRLEQLRAIGHRTDKVDLIVMGGTFTSRPTEYQDWFVKRCFDAMNGTDAPDIESAHLLNETAKARCVGLTIETRPDWFDKAQLSHSMYLGATKVEFGVQILDDAILDGVKRGHHVKQVVDATKRVKDAGLKLCYHIMPGLPGSNKDRDLESFRLMFEDERFRPDMLKIYPTLVVKGTELYGLWQDGKYEPMSLDETIEMLSEIKKGIPSWVRISRIQRDIPVQLIEAGVKKSHLRQLVMTKLREEGTPCRCIRCREVGHVPQAAELPSSADIEFREVVYRASGGMEHFLSFEVPSIDSLIGYARLRFPGSSTKSALVRELHVYGQMVPFEERVDRSWQHRGYGLRLLSECEVRASEAGFDEVRVTSGVGARNYYRRLGYERSGYYMSKPLARA